MIDCEQLVDIEADILADTEEVMAYAVEIENIESAESNELRISRNKAIERLRDRKLETKVAEQKKFNDEKVKSSLARAKWREHMKDSRTKSVDEAVDRYLF